MRLLLGLLFLGSASAQLPEAPIKAYAVNLALDQRYSLSNSSWETAPRVTVDYRIDHRWRVGLTYGHSFIKYPSERIGPRPSQTNSLSLGVNFKPFEWGARR